jgi:hypothetical protein
MGAVCGCDDVVGDFSLVARHRSNTSGRCHAKVRELCNTTVFHACAGSAHAWRGAHHLQALELVNYKNHSFVRILGMRASKQLASPPKCAALVHTFRERFRILGNRHHPPLAVQQLLLGKPRGAGKHCWPCSHCHHEGEKAVAHVVGNAVCKDSG